MNVPLNLLLAHMLLNIWTPRVWAAHPNTRRRRQLHILYRTRGIVLHDRALNDEFDLEVDL